MDSSPGLYETYQPGLFLLLDFPSHIFDFIRFLSQSDSSLSPFIFCYLSY